MLSKLFARVDKRALAGLDVLRGVAILLVLVAHFLPGDVPHQREIALSCANLGVILFFFLSGFLMDKTFAAESRLFPYVVRRSFRILPMYWISIGLIFIIDGTWTPRDAFANATFITQVMHVTRMSGVYWTLYIEVMFYALVPILWLLGRRAIYCAPFALMAAFTGAWLMGSPFSDAPFYLVYCLAGMLFGAWHREALGGAALTVSLVAVIVGSSILPSVSPFLGLAPLFCGTLLYVALRFPFRFAALEIAGDVSYSWYLLHLIFGNLVLNAALALGCNAWLSASLGIAAAFALSVATFLVIERPTINLGKKLIKMRSTDFVVGATT